MSNQPAATTGSLTPSQAAQARSLFTEVFPELVKTTPPEQISAATKAVVAALVEGFNDLKAATRSTP